MTLLEEVREIADQCFEQGKKRFIENPAEAREYFRKAWGFYMHLENTDYMHTCENFLVVSGLTREELKAEKRKGFQESREAIEVYEAFVKSIGGKHE